MEQTIQITKDMTIAEILEQFPHQSQRLAQLITNAGLHCVGCGAATWETLEGGMYGHGKSDKEIQDLLEKLNALLKEEIDLETITLTPKAAKKFIELSQEEGKMGCGLRFGDSAGGCSGFEYILEFSDGAQEDDEIFESEGVQIHVKKGMVKRLKGCVIDFIDGLQPGFKIGNPNAKSSCGCGRSQNY